MLPSNETLARNLAGAIRFRTVSDEDESKMDFNEFSGLHKYLEDTFPLLHRTFKREIVGKAGLLYSWCCKEPAVKPPVLLAAHQDVVPEGELSDWKYPPYEGIIADSCVWGRGSLDCKNLILGHMEALEALLREGFTPDYDIYLAYGYNEDVSITTKEPSAELIVQELQRRGIRPGVVFDEGGQIYPGSTMGVDGLVAQVAVAEKGTADFVVYKEGKGGHSASPGKNCLVGDVARAAVKIADNLFPYRFIPEMALQYKLLSPYTDEDKREIYADVISNQDKIIPMLDEDPRTAARFQTTVAMTTVSGSERSNILPTRVSVNLNCRMLKGDTLDSVLAYFKELIDEDSGVRIELVSGRNPSPFSDVENPLYDKLKNVIEEMYPGIKVLPSLCIGGTDAYFYYSVCDCVYRFTGKLPHPKNGAAHAANERLAIENMQAVPEFFYRYLRSY